MGHRTAEVITGLGVRSPLVVGAQGPENSLTTASPTSRRAVELRIEQKERREGQENETLRSTGNAKDTAT